MARRMEVPSLETRVRIFRALQGRRELLGFAELIIGGAFVIRDICIVRTRPEHDEPGEPFVSFPSKRGTGAGEGKFFDVAHPITAEARRLACETILRAYREAASAAPRTGQAPWTRTIDSKDAQPLSCASDQVAGLPTLR